VPNTITSTSAFAYLWHDGEFVQLRLAARPDDVAAFAADPDCGTTEIDTARGAVRMTAHGQTKSLVVGSDQLTIDRSFSDENVDVSRWCTPTGPTGWGTCRRWQGRWRPAQ